VRQHGHARPSGLARRRIRPRRAIAPACHIPSITWPSLGNCPAGQWRSTRALPDSHVDTACLPPAAWNPALAETLKASLPAFDELKGAWTSGEEKDQQLRHDLVDLLPPDELQTILNAALDQLDAPQEHNGRLTPHKLYNHLCPRLAHAFGTLGFAGSYGGELRGTRLHLLVKRAPQVALATCQ